MLQKHFEETPTYDNKQMCCKWATLVENLTLTIGEVKELIDAGAKFKRFPYCISIVVMTYKHPGRVYFVPKRGTGIWIALWNILVTVLLGWRGLPWGPIYSIGAIFQNLFGGEDVTEEICGNLGI